MDEWHDPKPATVNGATGDARESWTLVLVAIADAGRRLARKRAGGALPLPGSVPSRRADGNAENPAIGPGENPTRRGRVVTLRPVRFIKIYIPNGPGACPAARSEPGLAGGSSVHAGGPAGLDVAEPPVGEGGRPDGDEQGDDAEPGRVDVEVGHDGPEGAVQVQFGGQHAEDLDGADDERRADGQPGDDQVVVDLADRPGERPAVGEVHEQAVQRVEQHHAAAEQERQ